MNFDYFYDEFNKFERHYENDCIYIKINNEKEDNDYEEVKNNRFKNWYIKVH